MLFSTAALAGGGPDEGKQNKLSDVPEGYKLVKKDADCKDPKPCAKEQAEIARLKSELELAKANLQELRDMLAKESEPKECPAPKTIVKTVEKPIERVVEKPVEKLVTKEVVRREISIGGMLAYSQDGIETEEVNPDGSTKDAMTYRSVIGGPYITIPIGERFEIGAFGMFGGVNQTFGGKLGLSL